MLAVTSHKKTINILTHFTQIHTITMQLKLKQINSIMQYVCTSYNLMEIQTYDYLFRDDLCATPIQNLGHFDRKNIC
jgi:hypothetical protein